MVLQTEFGLNKTVLFEADTLNTDAEIIGPGTVYVGRTFNYNYQNWSDFSFLQQ